MITMSQKTMHMLIMLIIQYDVFALNSIWIPLHIVDLSLF